MCFLPSVGGHRNAVGIIGTLLGPGGGSKLEHSLRSKIGPDRAAKLAMCASWDPITAPVSMSFFSHHRVRLHFQERARDFAKGHGTTFVLRR